MTTLATEMRALLDSTPPRFDEFFSRLESATASVEWGERIIRPKNRSEYVALDTLAYLFCSAIRCDVREPRMPLEDRVNYFKLQGKIAGFYSNCTKIIASSCIYPPLVAFNDATQYPFALQARNDICDWENSPLRKKMLAFTPEDFKTHWPDLKPACISTVTNPYGLSGNDVEVQIYYAAYYMLQSKIHPKSD